MALHPRESGSRRLRQGLERLAGPVRIQRGTIIVGGRFAWQLARFPIHINARQAVRLPYNSRPPSGLFRSCVAGFPNPSQWAFDSVNRIVLRHWQSRNILIGFRALA